MDMEHAVLLIIDMQNDFIHPEGFVRKSAQGIGLREDSLDLLNKPIPCIKQLAQRFRSTGRDVFLIYTAWQADYSDVALPLRKLGPKAREHGALVIGSWGAQIILPFSYGGSNGLLSQDTHDAELWRRLGTSRLDRTVCAAPTGAGSQALYGKMASGTYADYAHATLIVIWGANPSSSGIHLVPVIREAQRNGAALVVIDPRATSLARLADLHLQVRPGTDLPVALAVHRYLFEQGRADLEFLATHARGADLLRDRAARWSIERAADEAGIDVVW